MPQLEIYNIVTAYKIVFKNTGICRCVCNSYDTYMIHAVLLGTATLSYALTSQFSFKSTYVLQVVITKDCAMFKVHGQEQV